MRCVLIDSNGFVVDVSPQPATVDSCSLVLATPAELGSSPFHLTVQEGGLIGAAIIALWATAFGLRQLRRALD